MLDLTYIRKHPDEVLTSVKRRGMHVALDRWQKLDSRRSELIPVVEQLRSSLKLTGKPTTEQMTALQATKDNLKQHEEELTYIEKEWRSLWEDLPNLIDEGTPDGGEEANQELKQVGSKPKFDFTAKDHLELNQQLNFVNFEDGAKAAGSRFYYLNDNGAALWDAIAAVAKQTVREAGFQMSMVPHMVNSQVAAGTGFLPRGEERQTYKVEDEDLILIATAELPLTGRYMNSILPMQVEQPILWAAVSPCYRLEAGAYGKFSKGLFRVHQFEKLEMYAYTTPDESAVLLEKILMVEEKICAALEIPYRVVRIAAGDLSAPAFRKYDIEYWSPSDETWRELTSCSNCTDYQARRLNIRYKQADGSLAFAHTLNGTAVTSSRTLIAVIENHQQADGSIRLPQAIADYYGKEIL